ncbi:MAG: TetR/AcrR family transcriptional regulator [Pseudomonadales bacterium]
MVRTREFDPDTALDSALEVFWIKGYNACSVADVVAETGVARYGLYQEFGDKDDLFRAALERYRSLATDLFLKPLHAPEAGRAEINAHFENFISMMEAGDRRGCMACQAAMDRAQQDPGVAEIVDKTMADMRDAFRHVLANALKNNEMRRLPLDSLTDYLTGLQRTLGTMVRTKTPASEITGYIRCALKLLDP